jgi:hypothetical protein
MTEKIFHYGVLMRLCIYRQNTKLYIKNLKINDETRSCARPLQESNHLHLKFGSDHMNQL